MKIIQSLYAGGTRGARVLNLAVAVVWVLGSALHFFNVIEIEIPQELAESIIWVFILAYVTAISSFLSLAVQKYRETLKYLSLHFGALLSSIIAAGFAAEYPPLSMTTITSTGFALWLLGAAYFAMESCRACEKEVPNDSTIGN